MNPALINDALHAVSHACSIARQVQHDLQRVRRITKDDRSPVTVADFAVQASIAIELEEHHPGALIVGEENADALRTDDQRPVRDEVVSAVGTVRAGATADDVMAAIDRGAHDGSADAYWVLDPIDGTKGFLRGQQYAIALGHIEHGVVTLGVLGCPNLSINAHDPLDAPTGAGTIFIATRGQGVACIPDNTPGAEPVPCRANLADDITNVRLCESVESAHSNQSDSARIVASLGWESTPVRLDSQCKYGIVARGDADAYLRLPTRKGYVEKIWDHAAGSLVATEGGAIVTDVTGAPLDFTHGRRLETNRGVICAVPAIHARIIEAITELGLSAPV